MSGKRQNRCHRTVSFFFIQRNSDLNQKIGELEKATKDLTDEKKQFQQSFRQMANFAMNFGQKFESKVEPKISMEEEKKSISSKSENIRVGDVGRYQKPGKKKLLVLIQNVEQDYLMVFIAKKSKTKKVSRKYVSFAPGYFDDRQACFF